MSFCKNCNKEIINRNIRATFCSDSCRIKWFNNINNKKISELKKINKVCVICNKEFTTTRKSKLSCSKNCQNKRNNLQRKKNQNKIFCKFCGKAFVTVSSKKIFCTDKCKNAYHSNKNRLNSKWKRIEKEYGLTREQWEKIYNDQNGRCAICKGFLENPHTDHDHNTGKVRGILCQQCNHALGLFKDSKEILLAAERYLS